MYVYIHIYFSYVDIGTDAYTYIYIYTHTGHCEMLCVRRLRPLELERASRSEGTLQPYVPKQQGSRSKIPTGKEIGYTKPCYLGTWTRIRVTI